jgi:hypothetical protein
MRPTHTHTRTFVSTVVAYGLTKDEAQAFLAAIRPHALAGQVFRIGHHYGHEWHVIRQEFLP